MIESFGIAARSMSIALVLWTISAAAVGQVLGERVSFPVGKTGGGTEVILGYLNKVPGSKTARPAVVLLIDSGGVRPDFLNYYGRLFEQLGLHVLIVDSFGPRGVQQIVTDQAQISSAQMTLDAFGAMKYLAFLSDVDPRKIVVIGHSKGGIAAWLAAHRNFAPDEKERFAAAIAFYPGCVNPYREPRPVTPTLMLLGQKDEYTGFKACVELAERSNAAGGQFKAIVYEGAPHGFDGPDHATGVTYNRQGENWIDCTIWQESDGSATLNGKRFPSAISMDLVAEARATCVRRGVSFYTHPQAKARSRADMVAFLESVLELSKIPR